LNEGLATTIIFVCLQCGRVEEFYDPEIEKAPARKSRRDPRVHDFRSTRCTSMPNCVKPHCPYRRQETN